MKLYVDIKKMIFEEENIEHEIVLRVSDIEFIGYDLIIDLKDNDKFVKDTMKNVYKKDKEGKDTKEIDYKQFIVREQKTWNSFPLYEIMNGEIINFDYTKYSYFANTDRRMALASKINELYNQPSEFKILRKTLKFILNELKLNYPSDFSIMDKKIEEIINKNLKEDSYK